MELVLAIETILITNFLAEYHAPGQKLAPFIVNVGFPKEGSNKGAPIAFNRSISKSYVPKGDGYPADIDLEKNLLSA